MPPESAKASDPDPRYTQKFYTGNDRVYYISQGNQRDSPRLSDNIHHTNLPSTICQLILDAQVGHKKRVGVTLGSANQCLIRSARWPSENERGYKIPDQEYGAMSGISISHNISQAGENIDLTVYQLASDVGGTWHLIGTLVKGAAFVLTCKLITPLDPGIRCDIPAVNYQISWSPKLDWPEFYPRGSNMLQRITERGFSDADAVEKELDVRTCATEFDTTFIPRFPFIAHGENLQDTWKVYPVGSYFMYYGPMGPASHGSAAPLIEAYSSAFLKMIKMQRENITSVTIKDKAADDFQEHQEMYVKRTAWIGPCSSWFRRTHDVC
ncbi:hypothetical protein C8J57DRAFT_1248197 [Mycena rebaudengoi]|nr:hypothetical protein C8J57DRAFT_1248197 [Mycena rebaudengoi]